jgi:uncharacterized protein YggT (Ycf19 family)
MGFLVFVCEAIATLVLVDALSSWVVKNPNAFPRNLTGPITAPLYKPVRAILNPEKMGGIDLSPLVVIVVFNLLASNLPRLAAGF